MLRLVSCWAALFTGIAAAAPCDAPPEAAQGRAEAAQARDCARELADLERKLSELLARVTKLHPDARSLHRDIEEKRQCAAPPSSPVAAAAPDAEISIDAAAARQVLHGFGATWPWSALDAERLGESQWRRAIGLLVDVIGARTGEAPPILEPPEGRAGQAVEGFSRPLTFFATEKLFGLYGRFAPGGLDDVFPSAGINVRWAHPWLRTLRDQDYRRYLDEVAAKAVAAVADWKQRTGREPAYLQLWNEPLSGNGELAGGNVTEIVDTMRLTAMRLREAGFERVRFIVPAEETVRNTLNVMRAIAADGEAMASVGAIAYHVYPYGSEYAYIPNLLATRALGREFDQPTRERLELRRTAELLRVPTWMNEVSHGYERGGGGIRDTSVPDSIDWIVGRAIHIHDEMRYAGASAFFGMMTVWSDAQERGHGGDAGARLRSEGDGLVLVDTARDEVMLGGIGHAIGHYGRWLRRGARYLDGTSSNPQVLVSPFRDRDRLVAVLVNMARSPVKTRVKVANAEISGPGSLEQTRTGVCREKLAPVGPREGTLELELPAWSVTTLAAPLR